MTELQDAEWLQGLVFMVDVTHQFNDLKKMNQGCNKVVKKEIVL